MSHAANVIDRKHYFVSTADRDLMIELHNEGYTIEQISQLTGFSTACISRQIRGLAERLGDKHSTPFIPEKHLWAGREHVQNSDDPEMISVRPQQAKAPRTKVDGTRTLNGSVDAHNYISVMSSVYKMTQKEIIDQMVELHRAHTRKKLVAANEA